MNIYVGNLPPELSEQDLQREFEAFGEVAYVVIVSGGQPRGGQSSGYGFVEMASKLNGSAAIAALNGKQMKSRYVDVVQALPLSDKASARRQRPDNPSGSSRKRDVL